MEGGTGGICADVAAWGRSNRAGVILSGLQHTLKAVIPHAQPADVSPSPLPKAEGERGHPRCLISVYERLFFPFKATAWRKGCPECCARY